MGAAALAAAAVGALGHPVAPALVGVALAAWCAACWRWPAAWLFVLPAALPLLDFSPWTGWLAVQEFDLLVLGTIGVGWLRRAVTDVDGRAEAPPRELSDVVWPAALLLLFAVGLLRGVADAGGAAFTGFGAFDGADTATNTLRLSKPLLWLALLWPLLRSARGAAPKWLPRGMVAGVAVVALAAAWERAQHPGLWDVTRPYRTVALFWEMHVGGAAIDAYLALAVPFVAWAVWRARRPAAWAGAAVLSLLVCYAALTTFSRGVYLAVGLPLVALAFAAWWHRRGVPAFAQRGRRAPRGWRRWASAALLAALGVEATAVLAPDSFMRGRWARSELDAGSRLAHWQLALERLQLPADVLLGLGAGRLPSNYARFAPGHEFSGGVRWVEAGQAGLGGHVQIDGPRSDRRLGGLYGLTQRVPLREAYALALDVRVRRPTGLYLRVCDTHLLYDGACVAAYLPAYPVDTGWQRVRLNLGEKGSPLAALAPGRSGVLTLSVVDAGGRADLDNLVLVDAADPDAAPLTANGDFDDGLARWLPAAQLHFLPWHADNLALEWLVERGLLGLLLFAAAVIAAVRRLRRSASGVAPFLAASLGGGLLVGAVSSVLDVPRVALLLGLLLAWAVSLPPAQRGRWGSGRSRRSESASIGA